MLEPPLKHSAEQYHSVYAPLDDALDLIKRAEEALERLEPSQATATWKERLSTAHSAVWRAKDAVRSILNRATLEDRS